MKMWYYILEICAQLAGYVQRWGSWIDISGALQYSALDLLLMWCGQYQFTTLQHVQVCERS